MPNQKNMGFLEWFKSPLTRTLKRKNGPIMQAFLSDKNKDHLILTSQAFTPGTKQDSSHTFHVFELYRKVESRLEDGRYVTLLVKSIHKSREEANEAKAKQNELIREAEELEKQIEENQAILKEKKGEQRDIAVRYQNHTLVEKGVVSERLQGEIEYLEQEIHTLQQKAASLRERFSGSQVLVQVIWQPKNKADWHKAIRLGVIEPAHQEASVLTRMVARIGQYHYAVHKRARDRGVINNTIDNKLSILNFYQTQIENLYPLELLANIFDESQKLDAKANQKAIENALKELDAFIKKQTRLLEIILNIPEDITKEELDLVLPLHKYQDEATRSRIVKDIELVIDKANKIGEVLIDAEDKKDTTKVKQWFRASSQAGALAGINGFVRTTAEYFVNGLINHDSGLDHRQGELRNRAIEARAMLHEFSTDYRNPLTPEHHLQFEGEIFYDFTKNHAEALEGVAIVEGFEEISAVSDQECISKLLSLLVEKEEKNPNLSSIIEKLKREIVNKRSELIEKFNSYPNIKDSEKDKLTFHELRKFCQQEIDNEFKFIDFKLLKERDNRFFTKEKPLLRYFEPEKQVHETMTSGIIKELAEKLAKENILLSEDAIEKTIQEAPNSVNKAALRNLLMQIRSLMQKERALDSILSLRQELHAALQLEYSLKQKAVVLREELPTQRAGKATGKIRAKAEVKETKLAKANAIKFSTTQSAGEVAKGVSVGFGRFFYRFFKNGPQDIFIEPFKAGVTKSSLNKDDTFKEPETHGAIALAQLVMKNRLPNSAAEFMQAAGRNLARVLSAPFNSATEWTSERYKRWQGFNQALAERHLITPKILMQQIKKELEEEQRLIDKLIKSGNLSQEELDLLTGEPGIKRAKAGRLLDNKMTEEGLLQAFFYFGHELTHHLKLHIVDKHPGLGLISFIGSGTFAFFILALPPETAIKLIGKTTYKIIAGGANALMHTNEPGVFHAALSGFLWAKMTVLAANTLSSGYESWLLQGFQSIEDEPLQATLFISVFIALGYGVAELNPLIEDLGLQEHGLLGNAVHKFLAFLPEHAYHALDGAAPEMMLLFTGLKLVVGMAKSVMARRHEADASILTEEIFAEIDKVYLDTKREIEKQYKEEALKKELDKFEGLIATVKAKVAENGISYLKEAVEEFEQASKQAESAIQQSQALPSLRPPVLEDKKKTSKLSSPAISEKHKYAESLLQAGNYFAVNTEIKMRYQHDLWLAANFSKENYLAFHNYLVGRNTDRTNVTDAKYTLVGNGINNLLDMMTQGLPFVSKLGYVKAKEKFRKLCTSVLTLEQRQVLDTTGEVKLSKSQEERLKQEAEAIYKEYEDYVKTSAASIENSKNLLWRHGIKEFLACFKDATVHGGKRILRIPARSQDVQKQREQMANSDSVQLHGHALTDREALNKKYSESASSHHQQMHDRYYRSRTKHPALALLDEAQRDEDLLEDLEPRNIRNNYAKLDIDLKQKIIGELNKFIQEQDENLTLLALRSRLLLILECNKFGDDFLANFTKHENLQSFYLNTLAAEVIDSMAADLQLVSIKKLRKDHIKYCVQQIAGSIANEENKSGLNVLTNLDDYIAGCDDVKLFNRLLRAQDPRFADIDKDIQTVWDLRDTLQNKVADILSPEKSKQLINPVTVQYSGRRHSFSTTGGCAEEAPTPHSRRNSLPNIEANLREAEEPELPIQYSGRRHSFSTTGGCAEEKPTPSSRRNSSPHIPFEGNLREGPELPIPIEGNSDSRNSLASSVSEPAVSEVISDIDLIGLFNEIYKDVYEKSAFKNFVGSKKWHKLGESNPLKEKDIIDYIKNNAGSRTANIWNKLQELKEVDDFKNKDKDGRRQAVVDALKETRKIFKSKK